MRWILPLAGLLLAAPAQAQNVIPTDGGPFVHARTGVGFPQSLAGMPRNRIMDFGDAQWDVAGTYLAQDGQVLLTVYLYRAGVPDISLNFDTIQRALASREGFRPGAEDGPSPQAFVPEGREVADSYRIAYRARSGGQFATDGVALVPHGDWLLKVRVSSNRHDPGELLDLIGEAVGELDLPASARQAGPARPVPPCTTPLAIEEARRAEPAFESVIPYALALRNLNVSVEASGQEQPGWCRDDAYGDIAVYRPGGRADAYVIALSDSGQMLEIGGHTDFLSSVLADNSPLTSAIHSDAARSVLVALLDGLPDPRLVMALLEGARPLIVTDRDGQTNVLVAPEQPGEA